MGTPSQRTKTMSWTSKRGLMAVTQVGVTYNHGSNPATPPHEVRMRAASRAETTAPVSERVETMSTPPQRGKTTPQTPTQVLTTVMQAGTSYKWLRYLNILDPLRLGGQTVPRPPIMAIFRGSEKTMGTPSQRVKTMPGTSKRGLTAVTQVGVTYDHASAPCNPPPMRCAFVQHLWQRWRRWCRRCKHVQRGKTRARAVRHGWGENSPPRGKY